jgi:hypothetical protein
MLHIWSREVQLIMRLGDGMENSGFNSRKRQEVFILYKTYVPALRARPD